MPPPEPTFSGQALWVCLALIAASFVVYASVWRHEFVTLDDTVYVTQNPPVSRGLTWQGVWWAFATGHASNWHPVTWLSHMLDVQLYGMNAGPHHLSNLLLHIANTLLLFGVFHRITGALGRSAFVAGLFAVHPLHVESVAWVAERKDVLSTLFWMLTLWAYVGYVREPRLGRYLGLLLVFALGLMAKPMVVTLPFVLLLLDVWPLGRVELGSESGSRSGLAPPADRWLIGFRLMQEKLPLLALTLASSIATFLVQQRGGAVGGFEALPLAYRVENALVSYVVYIGKMLWPTRLALFYPYPRSLPEWWVLGSFLFLSAVSVLVIRAARRHPYLPVGWLWYLGTLVPVIGLVQVGGQAMADRYTYIPFIGLFVIVAWGVPGLLSRLPHRKIALRGAAALALLALTLIARAQVPYWKNSMVLWGHALEVTTGNYQAHNNLGAFLVEQEMYSEAIAHYREALRTSPDFADAHNNLANALANLRQVSEAVAHYTEALRIKPDHANAHNGLGAALAKEGRFTEAIAHYSEALRIEPDLVDAHNNWGSALADQGQIDAAIQRFLEALQIQPDHADAHYNLGVMLHKKGNIVEAAQHYGKAIRSKPPYAEAHFGLGLASLQQKKVEEAARHFEAALQFKPDYSEARLALNALGNRGTPSGPPAVNE